MNIHSIRPYADNVLVMFEHHEKARQEEDKTPGGIYIPRTAHAPKDGEAIIATVIAAGPGHYADPFLDHEAGTDPYRSGKFIPIDAGIKPGVRVLLEGAAKGGDRVYSDDRMEYRMVRAHCIAAVIEE